MSKVAIRVRVNSETEGYIWQRLSLLITDGLAATTGVREYEFYTHGDAIGFQLTCDDLGVKYIVTDLSKD
jgi:hypothetical protein